MTELDDLLARACTAPVPLATVDEAQLLAVGWLPPARGAGEQYAGSRSPHDFPGLAAAQDALLAAGLATLGARDTPAELSAAGGLRTYLDLVGQHRLQTSNWQCWIPDAATPVDRLARRLTVVRGGEVVVVERTTVPAPPQPERPLPVEIALVPLDGVLAELAGLAYRAPTPAERAYGPRLRAVFVGPDRALADFPSLLERDWDAATATLRWRSMSLFGRRAPGEKLARNALTVRRLTSDGYRDHLRRRLLTPEPSG